jgi:hypothetical protein
MYQHPLPLFPLLQVIAMIIYSSKYYTKYNQIVKHYKELDLKKSGELYTESHHIIPKSMGGSNSKDNLVRVPARVHFLLHWMLYRIYKTRPMVNAWNKMRQSSTKHIRYTSKSFAYIRTAIVNCPVTESTRAKMSAAGKGRKLSESAKINMSNSKKGALNPFFGKTFSTESLEKISASSLGRTHTKLTKQKISDSHKGELNPFFGMTHSIETKNKISQLHKNKIVSTATKEKLSVACKLAAALRPVLTCPHCGLASTSSRMKTYHFGNCKSLLVMK